MKRITGFIKTTTLGGLFVVLPAMVVSLLLAKMVTGIRAGAGTVMEKLLGQESGAAQFPIIFAILIVVAMSFVFGLAMTWKRGQSMGESFEERVLFRIPGYAAARAIVGGLGDARGRRDKVRIAQRRSGD